MLNEVFTLSQALARCGVGVAEIHPWVKRLRRGEGLILGVGTEGSIEAIEYLDPTRASELSNITPSNQRMFPGINLMGPIWELPIDSPMLNDLFGQNAPRDKHWRLDLITRSCASAKLAYQLKDLKRLKALIEDFPRRELLSRFPNTQPDFAAFPELLRRLAIRSGSPEDFLHEFTYKSIEACRASQLDALELIKSILFGKWNPRDHRFRATTTSLVLDLADCSHYPRRVADPRMGGYFSQSLADTESEEISSLGICSLTGRTVRLETEKLPSPRLPVLADTYLMSMNEDAPCQFRYGLISTQVFPVGKKTARELNNALIKITNPESKGRTWMSIPGSAPKKQDLLISYLEDRPVTAIKLASLFAEPSSGDEMVEELFEQTARAVCDALKGDPSVHRSSLLRLMVLTKIDKGRAQVVFSGAFSVDQILDAAEEWQFAARNHPEIRIRMPGLKKGEKARLQEPACPFPALVQRCLRTKWVRSGGGKRQIPGVHLTHTSTRRISAELWKKCEVHGPPLSDIYCVFLEKGRKSQTTAARLLQRTLTLELPLLLGLSHAQRLGQSGISDEGRRSSLTAISLLSVLLHKLGHRKEKFMEESFFLVGRLFSLADTLHKEYCKVVRKGHIPPQLIGNSLIGIAMENPERGIARLFERLRIYQAWAQTASGDDVGLAKWSLGQIGRIADGLGHQTLHTRADDAAKAKMVLGYLAWATSEANDQDR